MNGNRPEKQNKKLLIRDILNPLDDEVICKIIYNSPHQILVRFFNPETFPIYDTSEDFERFLLDGCFSKIKEWQEITIRYEYYDNMDEVETIIVEGEIEIENVDLIRKHVAKLIDLLSPWNDIFTVDDYL